MNLNEFNTLSKQEANAALKKCCVSESWIEQMIENRPFATTHELLKKAASIWYNSCKPTDWKAAFKGHPKIGDINSLREKFKNTKNWANQEQANVAEADETTLKNLAEANEAYLAKFGYIFIVSASGKSARQLLQIINARVSNTKEDELYIAMGEQHKITVIRLCKLISELSTTADLRSYITTHVLDTTTGIPGKNIQITLKEQIQNHWRPITIGITDIDGRITDVLPAGKRLEAGNYQLVFKTDAYYSSQEQQGFYPEVAIQFIVSNHDHYHVPLLLNPYGYTTYRGS